ncbi:hypothetical protein AB0A63_28580 [Lentzea sp. NPDC042327]|uniref:hypothetical protein n=1 Tax=Lentzea sp. NPDC042327 TaxID=3154801 RepID=UPI0033CEC67F
MTDPTPEPSPEAAGQNPRPAPEPGGDPQPGTIPPAPDPQEILKAISGIDLATIDADIESAFGSRMAQLDEMLAGLDSLVDKIEKDIQNLDQPKPDGPQ